MDIQRISKLHALFNIFPVEGGGDKAPAIIRDELGKPRQTKDGSVMRFAWGKVQKEKVNINYLSQFNSFGVCCGIDGLEVIDVDNTCGNAEELYQYISDNIDIENFYVVRTQRKGYHIYFRCEYNEGSQKLATRPTEVESSTGAKIIKDLTMVETRGIGGYVVYYDDVVMGSLDTIPTITKDERQQIFEVCKSLNESEKDVFHYDVKKPKKTGNTNDKRPGDIYNEKSNVLQKTADLLTSHGWSSSNGKHWVRPDKSKKNGISATLGVVGKNKDMFYVFSSNAHPFAENTCYSPFSVLAILKYNGDFSAAAKDLAEEYDLKKTFTEPINGSCGAVNGEPVNKQGEVDKWDVFYDIIQDWDLNFRYNELINSVEYQRGGVGDYKNDIDIVMGDIVYEMEHNRSIYAKNAKGEIIKKQITINKQKVKEMILNNTTCDVYNPIKAFIASIPKHDGKDYFAELFKYLYWSEEENTDYCMVMLYKQMIRSLRCAIEKDYINRIVFTFLGGQDIGKSKFLQWLVPAEIYNDEQIDPGDKDSKLRLARYFLLNLDELDSLKKNEIAKLKAFISKSNVNQRVAYGSFDQRFDRVASLYASTNKNEILLDDEDTRWIIVRIMGFDWRGYTKNIDPIKLWAQCYDAYLQNPDAGELTNEEKLLRNTRNMSEFLDVTYEHEILCKYFVDDTKSHMSASDVLNCINENIPKAKVDFTQLKRELRRKYGKAQTKKVKGNSVRGFPIMSNFPVSSSYGSSIENFYEVDKLDF